MESGERRTGRAAHSVTMKRLMKNLSSALIRVIDMPFISENRGYMSIALQRSKYGTSECNLQSHRNGGCVSPLAVNISGQIGGPD